MSYTYVNGTGPSVLLTTEPADAENVAVSDEAIIQIKKYLLDPTSGPEALYTALKAEITAFLKNAGVTSGTDPIPTGFVGQFSATDSFSGWLLCDGSAVSRSTYSGLFAVIGVTFGAGDNVSTFNLPDLRGKTIIGEDLTFQVVRDGATLGNSIGTKTHTLALTELPEHKHPCAADNFFTVENTGTRSHGYDFLTSGPGYYFNQTVTASAGGGGAHNNIMPSFVLNSFIKT